MAYGHPVEPPAGYLSLCIRSPVDCAQTNTVEAHQQMVRSAREAAQLQWRRRIDEVLRRTVTQEPQARETRVSTPGASVALMDTVAGPAGGQVRDQAHFQAPSPAPIPTAVDDRVDIVQDEIASRTSSGARPSIAPLALTAEAWAQLTQVNSLVNARIRPVPAKAAFGADDMWVAPISSGLKAVGDCKEYVLQKRRDLIAAGVPASVLTIATATTRWGELHAVLLVATDRGDLVLDNLTPEIRRWDQSAYVWRSRQSAEDPLLWLAVRDPLREPVLPTPRMESAAAVELAAGATTTSGSDMGASADDGGEFH